MTTLYKLKDSPRH